MICKNCGNTMEEGVKFCSNCGQPIEENIIFKPQITPSEENVNTEEQVAPVDTNNNVEQENNSVEESISNGQVTLVPEQDTQVNIENNDTDSFNQEPIPNTQENNSVVTELQQPKKSDSKVGLIVGVSVGVLILLLGIVSGVILVFKAINTKQQKQPTISIKIKTTTNATKTTEKASKSDNNVGSNWKDYTVSINGKNITLPCSYSDLTSATGAKMKEVQEGNSLESNYYSLANLYKGDKFALSIELLNDTSAPLKQKDAKVTRISQTKYNKTSADVDMVFPGNFKPGMAVDGETIKKVLGEPTNVRNYDADNYKSETYLYNADSTYTTINYYKIEVVNGEINELTLDHRNY